MTSRRGFLGLLAAAPVLGPAALKVAVEPRYASGIAGEVFWSPLIEGSVHNRFTLSPSQSKAFFEALDRPVTVNLPLEALMRASAPLDVPNRLFGVRVNEDGDAV